MDLGSNSFKMTVAQWSPDQKRNPFRILHKERHPIQLGHSVFKNGRISDRDFKEGLKALAKMQVRLRDFASPVLRVVATSAIRDSSNGRDFVQQARNTLGIPIEVISGPEEARLISHGLSLEYPAVKRGLLIDIGGGSTEVAHFGLGWENPFCHSFRVGSVRLATKFFGGARKPQLHVVRKAVASHLKLVAPGKIEKLVGSAGTIQSLGEILGKGRGPLVIKRAELDDWIASNLRQKPEVLVKQHGLTPSRARVVVPGAIVLSEVMRWLGRVEITVTAMTLRDGIMVDLVENWQAAETRILKGGTLPSKSPLRRREDTEFLKHLEATVQRFKGDMGHANHITALALSVFDQMRAQKFPFGLEERRILMVAAYLHDIGKIISEGGHQKHSAYILRNLRFPGMTPLDSKKAALVALYHRKDAPPKKDPLPGDLRGVHAEQVRRMVAILRLADGLDESHTQNVRAIKLSFSRKQALMELLQSKPDATNLDYFRDKAAYFEELFGLKIVSFVQHRRVKK
ncbi:MAG: Ppx/GppA family phosphatase [Bdellovibrionales bacterium]|nr:Ppx/GppA family phosphatase [Bdellovibrionales bacterium]